MLAEKAYFKLANISCIVMEGLVTGERSKACKFSRGCIGYISVVHKASNCLH